jgi:hypothetical protein
MASRILCNALLQSKSPSERQALLHYLSQEEKERFSDLPPVCGSPDTHLERKETLLEKVHYSWIAPLLRKFPENEIRLLLSSLNEEQVKGLKKALLFSNSLYALPSLAKTFFRSYLAEQLSAKELLPPECLPQDPLNELLALNHTGLVQLANFLGMRDLALEMKQIIDNTKLKQIHQALSPDEKLYLKQLMQQKEGVSFRPLKLAAWDGQEKSLKALIHQRGLNRLAKALCNSSSSLVWYVSHQFDVERAELLRRLSTPPDHEQVIAALAAQVLELIPSIQHLMRQKR